MKKLTRSFQQYEIINVKNLAKVQNGILTKFFCGSTSGSLLENNRKLVWERPNHRARYIQPKFAEISVQNSMDRFGPTGKVSKKLVHLWSSFPLFSFWLNGSRPSSPIKPLADMTKDEYLSYVQEVKEQKEVIWKGLTRVKNKYNGNY